MLAVAAWAAAEIATPASASQASPEFLLGEANKTMLVDPTRAASVANDVRMSAVAIGDYRRRVLIVGAAERIMAECALRLDDLTKAKEQIGKAINTLSKVGGAPKLMAEALLTRGGVNAGTEKVASALSDYQAAFRGFQQIGDDRSQAIALSMIAILYANAKDNASALRYLTQASELARTDRRLAVVIANNRGNALQNLGRHREAETVFADAKDLADQLGGNLLRAQVMSNMARNRLVAGNLDAAELMIAKAMPLTRSGEGVAWRSQVLSLAAEAALRRHSLSSAGKLIGESLIGVDPGTTTITNWAAHDTAYRIFTALHEPAKALPHLVALKRLDDEATKLATSTSTALMGARFDFANQELRIARLRAEDLRRSVVAEQEKARFARSIFLVVAGATAAIIALLGWLLFTIRRSRDSIRAANAGLATTNAALGKALAAKTEFLATTSHEIRTPLNGILGMTEVMLADRSLAPAVRDRLGVVHAAGSTMRALVDDILDVAKMEAGNLTVERAPFDLRATLDAAASLWEAQCRNKGLSFHLRLKGCPTVVMGDVARVRQIVFNLLANAVKFTVNGSVSLTVDHDRDRGVVAISVADTGVGIDVAQQDAIFEAFRQADASTTRRFGGTGLGLSISRNLAEAMHGRVTVASALGEGATFTLILPLDEEQAAETTTAAIVKADYDLLVLDRNPIGRAMMRSLLSPRIGVLGFAAEPTEVMAAIAADRPARLLIEGATIDADAGVAMRIADAARRVGTRTVLLWPQDRGEDHAALRAAGIDRIVTRPFSSATLIEAVESCGPALVTEAA